MNNDIELSRELTDVISKYVDEDTSLEEKQLSKYKDLISIGLFIQTKEFIITKDEDEDKTIHFDCDENSEYIPIMMDLLDYVKTHNNKFDNTSDTIKIDIKNIPDEYKHKYDDLCDAVWLMNKIRDSFRHNQYELNKNDHTVYINNDSKNDAMARINGTSYKLECNIPISLLDRFSTRDDNIFNIENKQYSKKMYSGCVAAEDLIPLRLLQIMGSRIAPDSDFNTQLYCGAIFTYMSILFSKKEKEISSISEKMSLFPFRDVEYDYYDSQINNNLSYSLSEKNGGLSSMDEFMNNFQSIYNEYEKRVGENDNEKLFVLLLSIKKKIDDFNKTLAVRNDTLLTKISNASAHSRISVDEENNIIMSDTKEHSNKEIEDGDFIIKLSLDRLMELLDAIRIGRYDGTINDTFDEMETLYDIDKLCNKIVEASTYNPKSYDSYKKVAEEGSLNRDLRINGLSELRKMIDSINYYELNEEIKLEDLNIKDLDEILSNMSEKHKDGIPYNEALKQYFNSHGRSR